MSRTFNPFLLLLIGGAVFFQFVPHAVADEPIPTSTSNETAPPDWLDDYLVTELGYNPGQLAEFKRNVSSNLLKDEQKLRAVIRHMKIRLFAASVESSSALDARNRNLHRIRIAESQARARPMRSAGHYSPPVTIRSYQRSRSGLFRGYGVLIRGS